MSIRPNPCAPVVWSTTEGAVEATAADDDFVARTTDGYMLRVEQMDRRNWWWQVYDPTGEEVVDSPWMMQTLRLTYCACVRPGGRPSTTCPRIPLRRRPFC